MSFAADALAARVRETGLLPAGHPVVVLLSGGRDSVALLDLAVLQCGPGAVSALHVNYGLRPESAGDEAACAALCRRLDVPLQTEHVAAPASAGNLQAWARDVRYGAGVRLAAARGGRLAAGHTTTDQAGDDPLPPRGLTGAPRPARDARTARAPDPPAARRRDQP